MSEMSADSTVATDASVSSSESRRVSFGAIHVREFERIVGDHPDTRIGVPLSIGWAFFENRPVNIDKYESDKVSKGNLRMSSITRKNVLHNVFGIPEEELRNAEKEVQKIRKQRDGTKNQSKIVGKTESAFKSAKRKIRRVLNAESFIRGLSAAASSGMMLSMSHQ
jgi:hypothetical protein